MKNSIKYLSIVAFIGISLLLTLSCDKKDDDSSPASPALKIASNADFGNVLVDQENRTLYFSANDISGESVCFGGCADVWPPLTADVFDLEIGADLDLVQHDASLLDGDHRLLMHHAVNAKTHQNAVFDRVQMHIGRTLANRLDQQ